MGNVSILDCTLRDGGYINNWKFGKKGIKGIIRNLEEAGIEIIECGFIRNVVYDEGTSVFTSMRQVAEVISNKKAGVRYSIMIEQHNHVDHLISECDGSGADIIRLTFRRNEWEEAKETIRSIMAKGYLVCVQPVGTASYDDESLLNLIKDVNEIKPYAFYLVDTLGIMYQHDVRRFYYLIDNNLSNDICLGFHSHNNLQMSFANAQEMIRMARQRSIIVDTSCYGMGRGVGNLATELFADYINNNQKQKYSLVPILNIVDKYLMPIYAEQRWGYDLPYFLSATVKCHPNYAAHLMKKETLSIENIEKILCMLPAEVRSEYSADVIEQLYLDFQKSEIDDREALRMLDTIIAGRPVLIMGSGVSIDKEKKQIDAFIAATHPFVITVNFIAKQYTGDAMFISNEKRLNSLTELGLDDVWVFITSNLEHSWSGNALVFNYASLLGEGEAADNAGAMLIRLLKKVSACKIYMAGFDGFGVDAAENYCDVAYKKLFDYSTAQKKNEDISRQLKLALSGIQYEVITKTKYEI